MSRLSRSKNIKLFLFALYIKGILVFLPILVSLFFIKICGTNVCYWDQWALVPLLEKLYKGSLSFADLFAQHNEHRIFFPRLVMLTVAHLTHYNTKAEMYVGWLFLCLSALVLWRIYKLCLGQHSSSTAFILIPWLIFSLRQWENLLWGWQFQIFMSVFFFLLAVFTLERNKGFDFHLVIPILSGIVSSFSFANGLLVWPIGFLQLFWQHKFGQQTFKSNHAKRLFVWTATGILVYVIYFSGYTKPAYHPSLSFFLHHPLSSVLYFLAVIGSPLAFKWPAVAMGLLLLCLYTYAGFMVAKRATVQPFLPVALILFALLSASILVVARSGFGVEQALSSRYTTITMLGVVGLYLLMLSEKLEGKKKKFLRVALLSLIFLIIVLYLGGIKKGIEIQCIGRMHAYYLQTYRFQAGEQLKQLCPDLEILKKGAQFLEKHNFNVFSKPGIDFENLPLVSYPVLGQIEVINDQPLEKPMPYIVVDTSRKSSIILSGWVVDQQARKACGGVFINVDGWIDVPALYGLNRRDVAKHFKNKSYRFCGFYASFATTLLNKGRHILTLKVVTANKKSYYLSKQKVMLEIK